MSPEQGVAFALHPARVAQEVRQTPGSGIPNSHMCLTWDAADEKPV